MNWLVIILAFAIAVLVGGFLAKWLERSRIGWSARRQIWTAAAVLPGFLTLATLVAIAWILTVGPGEGENMQDLAVTVTIAIGAWFAVVTLLGGLAGAYFASREAAK